MGYSRSRTTLEKIMPELGPLREGREAVFNTTPGEAHVRAYKIREALYIANIYSDEYPVLADVFRRFKVYVVDDSKIEVRQQIRPKEERAQNNDAPSDEPDAPAAEPLFTSVTDVGSAPDEHVYTKLEIVSEWQRLAPERIHYPRTSLSRDDLISLYQWAQSNKLLMFYSHNGSLTLREFDEDLEDVAWQPEDLND